MEALVPQHRQEEWYQSIISAIQSIGGGGTGVVVTYVDNSGTITCSHTFAEIKTLIDNGILVRAKFGEDYMSLSAESDTLIQFCKSAVWMDTSTHTIQINYSLIRHSSDGTITQDTSGN